MQSNKKQDGEVIWTSFVEEDITSVPVLLCSETGQGLIVSEFSAAATTHTTVCKSALYSVHTHTCTLKFS